MSICFILLRSLTEGENPVMKRSHLIGILLTVSAIIVVAATLCDRRGKAPEGRTAPIVVSSSRDVCTTDTCKAEAFRIKSNIKQSVEPCDNFYDFACGGWEATHPRPLGEHSWNQFKDTNNITTHRVKEILEKDDKHDDIESIKSARKFYRTCLATFANIQPSFDIFLKKLSMPGGWPMVSNNWEPDKFDWQSLIVELERTTKDVSPLFKIDVIQNPKNISYFVLQLAPSLSPDMCIEFRKIETLDGLPLQHPLTVTAHLLSQFTNKTFYATSDEDEDTKAIKFAKKFCEITKREFERTDSDPYPSTSLSEFQAMSDNLTLTKSSSKVDWTKLLKQFVNGSDVELTEDDVIIIQSDVILDIIKLVDDTPERTLANYIYLHKVRSIKSFYSEEAVQNQKSQEESCILQTQQIFPHAIGREYVQLHLTEGDLKEVKHIMTQLRSFFSTDILKSNKNWMDSSTRSTATSKAENMFYIVGYPYWYDNTNRIDDMYSKIHVGDSHIENLESSTLGSILFRLKFLREKAERSLFVKGAAEPRAAYSHMNNVLQIPAGMIQPPFYIRGRPPALNFGSFVSIIAHEITHAFDIDGRQKDELGKAVHWWSKSAFEAYKEKAECFEDQYSQYHIKELEGMKEKHRHLDGFRTLSENLADNGGVEAAFGAYEKHYEHLDVDAKLPGLAKYTPDQLFFIGYASNWCESSSWQSIISSVLFDSHSPSKYRVLIPLSNSEEFSRAWNCPSPSNMNIKPKCHFWTPGEPALSYSPDFKLQIDDDVFSKLINETIQKINKGGVYKVTILNNNP